MVPISNSCIAFLIRAQVIEYHRKNCYKCFKQVQLSNRKDIAQLFNQQSDAVAIELCRCITVFLSIRKYMV